MTQFFMFYDSFICNFLRCNAPTTNRAIVWYDYTRHDILSSFMTYSCLILLLILIEHLRARRPKRANQHTESNMTHLHITWLILCCTIHPYLTSLILFECVAERHASYCLSMSPKDSPKKPIITWQKFVGCLKMQVSFRKRATNYRFLLQETTYKDTASYGSLLHCTYIAI